MLGETLEYCTQLYAGIFRSTNVLLHCYSLPCNAAKNRYRNVLAPDHSRVKLVDSDSQVDRNKNIFLMLLYLYALLWLQVEGGDYINASSLDSITQKKAYIVTQVHMYVRYTCMCTFFAHRLKYKFIIPSPQVLI